MPERRRDTSRNPKVRVTRGVLTARDPALPGKRRHGEFNRCDAASHPGLTTGAPRTPAVLLAFGLGPERRVAPLAVDCSR